MEISVKKIYEISLYTIFLILLINVSARTLAFSLVLAIILLLIYLLQSKRYKIYSNWALVYLMLIFGLLFIEYIRLNFLSNTTISSSSIFLLYGGALLFILVFPIYEVLCSNRDAFLYNIVLIGYGVLLFRALMWGMHNFLHINFLFYGYGGGRTGWSRSIGGVLLERSNGTFIDGLLFAYSLSNLFSLSKVNVNRFKSLLGIIFLYIFAGIIYQSRVQILFYSFTLLIALLHYNSKRKNNLLWVFLVIFSILFLYILFQSRINAFLGSFSPDAGEMGWSTQVRMVEYSYFKQLWSDSNKWLGFGLISDAGGILRWSEGTTYQIYMSDVGFILQLYQFGIIGLIIDSIPLIKGMFTSIKALKKNSNTYNSFIIYLTIYLVISCTSFNPYVYILIPILPLYVGILMNADYLQYL